VWRGQERSGPFRSRSQDVTRVRDDLGFLAERRNVREVVVDDVGTHSRDPFGVREHCLDV